MRLLLGEYNADDVEPDAQAFQFGKAHVLFGGPAQQPLLFPVYRSFRRPDFRRAPRLHFNKYEGAVFHGHEIDFPASALSSVIARNHSPSELLHEALRPILSPLSEQEMLWNPAAPSRRLAEAVDEPSCADSRFSYKSHPIECCRMSLFLPPIHAL